MVLLIRRFLIILLPFLFCGCQLGYIAESAYYQADLLRRRVPLKYALKNLKLTNEQKQKIELAITIREFMSKDLNLNVKDNYNTYVHLKDKYVTYIVTAAPKNELKSYKWSFPFIGEVPYKGYFKKEKAVAESKELKKKDLDIYVRGVTAYSTLGWFEDPLLSSMLRYREHHFINTLIHETVHANLYIKGKSKFNERVATFMGQIGAETYYKKQNKVDEIKALLKDEGHDELLFSKFISKEITSLKKWYTKNQTNPDLLTLRLQKFEELKSRFSKEVLPKMKTKSYGSFAKRDLNNASIMQLGLYVSDFSDLEIMANHYNRDFSKLMTYLKTLEDSDEPEKKLKQDSEKIKPAKS